MGIYNYKTSQDYQKLAEYISNNKEERVVCLVYKNIKNKTIPPVIGYSHFKNNCFELATIGICWFNVENKQDFIKMCHQYNIEYIEPNLK